MKNFVTSFVVGKSGGGANVGTGLESIKKGDILIVDYMTGNVLTGTSNTVTTSPIIAIAYCMEDGKPMLSGPIYGKSLVAGGKTAYVAPVQQVSGVGYTSVSTGSKLPTVSTAETFNVSVVVPTELRLAPNRQVRYDYSVVSLGGYDLARQIKMNVNADADINPHLPGNELFYANVTANGTQSNVGTAATATVTKGTNKVTFSAVHGLSAGAVLYFPKAGVFKVATVVSTTVVNLDAPYHAESEVIAADTVKSLATVTSYGFTIHAKEIKRTNPVNTYDQVFFEIGLSENFGLAPVVVTAYKRAVGAGWQLRDKEVSCMGWNGYTDRRDVMRAEYPFQTELAKNYLTVELSSIAPVQGDLQQTLEGPQSVFIAFDNAASTQSTAVLAILAPWSLSGGVSLA